MGATLIPSCRHLERSTLFLLLSLTTILLGCGRHSKKIDQLVMIRPIPMVVVGEPKYGTPSETIVMIGNDRYKCSRQPITKEEAFHDYIILQPNADILYPGSLIHGKGLTNGLLEPIDIKRSSGRLTLINLNNTDTSRMEISTVDLGIVSDAISKMLPEKPEGQLANVEFHWTEAHSLEQSMLDLGASAKWLSAAAKARLKRQFENHSNKLMILFKQGYYTVVFDRNNTDDSYRPSSLVDEGVSIDEFSQQIGPDSTDPPAFIKSVTYGRMLYAILSSDSSHQTIERELRAKLKSPKGSGTIDLSELDDKISSHINMTAFIVGGAAKDGIEFLAHKDLDGLSDYLRAGASWSKSSPGAPIAYKAVYMNDQKVASVKETVNYTKMKWDINPPIIDKIEVHFNGITDTKEHGTSVRFEALRKDSAGEWRSVGDTEYLGPNVEWQGNAHVGTIKLTEYADRVDIPFMKVVMHIHGGDDLAANNLIFVIQYREGPPAVHQVIPRDDFREFILRSKDGRVESPLLP